MFLISLLAACKSSGFLPVSPCSWSVCWQPAGHQGSYLLHHVLLAACRSSRFLPVSPCSWSVCWQPAGRQGSYLLHHVLDQSVGSLQVVRILTCYTMFLISLLAACRSSGFLPVTPCSWSVCWQPAGPQGSYLFHHVLDQSGGSLPVVRVLTCFTMFLISLLAACRLSGFLPVSPCSWSVCWQPAGRQGSYLFHHVLDQSVGSLQVVRVLTCFTMFLISLLAATRLSGFLPVSPCSWSVCWQPAGRQGSYLFHHVFDQSVGSLQVIRILICYTMFLISLLAATRLSGFLPVSPCSWSVCRLPAGRQGSNLFHHVLDQSVGCLEVVRVLTCFTMFLISLLAACRSSGFLPVSPCSWSVCWQPAGRQGSYLFHHVLDQSVGSLQIVRVLTCFTMFLISLLAACRSSEFLPVSPCSWSVCWQPAGRQSSYLFHHVLDQSVGSLQIIRVLTCYTMFLISLLAACRSSGSLPVSPCSWSVCWQPAGHQGSYLFHHVLDQSVGSLQVVRVLTCFIMFLSSLLAACRSSGFLPVSPCSWSVCWQPAGRQDSYLLHHVLDQSVGSLQVVRVLTCFTMFLISLLAACRSSGFLPVSLCSWSVCWQPAGRQGSYLLHHVRSVGSLQIIRVLTCFTMFLIGLLAACRSSGSLPVSPCSWSVCWQPAGCQGSYLLHHVLDQSVGCLRVVRVLTCFTMFLISLFCSLQIVRVLTCFTMFLISLLAACRSSGFLPVTPCSWSACWQPAGRQGSYLFHHVLDQSVGSLQVVRVLTCYTMFLISLLAACRSSGFLPVSPCSWSVCWLPAGHQGSYLFHHVLDQSVGSLQVVRVLTCFTMFLISLLAACRSSGFLPVSPCSWSVCWLPTGRQGSYLFHHVLDQSVGSLQVVRVLTCFTMFLISRSAAWSHQGSYLFHHVLDQSVGSLQVVRVLTCFTMFLISLLAACGSSGFLPVSPCSWSVCWQPAGRQGSYLFHHFLDQSVGSLQVVRVLTCFTMFLISLLAACRSSGFLLFNNLASNWKVIKIC